MTTTAGTFVGDSQFVGDGGASLQRLWEFAEWKMIRNCPGRYVLRHRKSCPVRIDEQDVTAVDTRALLSAAFGEEDVGAITVHCLQSERCADAVRVAVFADGGGVITYCKQSTSDSNDSLDSNAQVKQEQEQEDQEALVFVHTLNTASGLQRKLEGLRIDHVLQL